MKNLKTKIGITLTALACFLTFGCSPYQLDEAKKPKIEYPGMPPYNTNDEFPFEIKSYVTELLFKKTPSAKKGLTPKIPLDGEVVSLKTFYEYGTPKNAQKDKDGFYPTEFSGIMQIKELRRLDPKEMSRTPMFTKDGKITVIDYDDGFDKKIEYRIIIQEKYIQGRDIVTTQELDIGADGTIEERLVTSPYEGYTFEKALE